MLNEGYHTLNNIRNLKMKRNHFLSVYPICWNAALTELLFCYMLIRSFFFKACNMYIEKKGRLRFCFVFKSETALAFLILVLCNCFPTLPRVDTGFCEELHAKKFSMQVVE